MSKNGRNLPKRRVVFLAYDGVQILDIAGPAQAFSTANDEAVTAPYEVSVAALTPGAVATASHFDIVAVPLPRAGLIDTLIVPGGTGVHPLRENAAAVEELRKLAGRATRVCAVCTGAFALAEAGLLDGKRATTHWASCQRLAEGYPKISVEPDAIYVREGKFYTSAGVTAGMDLALALLEEDFGRECAIKAARWLVMFAKRPGGQSQFSSHLAAQAAERAPIRMLQEWILENLTADLSVSALAERVGMSPRNFARVFRREAGATPAEFVEAARIDAARRELEETAHPVERVAGTCGFSTAEHMRRAFHRRLGASPYGYRTRFQSPAVAYARGA